MEEVIVKDVELPRLKKKDEESYTTATPYEDVRQYCYTSSGRSWGTLSLKAGKNMQKHL